MRPKQLPRTSGGPSYKNRFLFKKIDGRSFTITSAFF